MKILLGGVPLGCDNIGDEAIIACVVKMLRRNFPDAELTVSTREQEKTARLLGTATVPLFGFPPDPDWKGFASEVRRHDIFMWFGATGLSDYPECGVRLLNIARRAGVQTVVWGVGMNTQLNPAFYRAAGRRLKLLRLLTKLSLGSMDWVAFYENYLCRRTRGHIRRALETCSLVMLRDAESVREVEKCGFTRAVAGADTAILQETAERPPLEPAPGITRIGFCISAQNAVKRLDGVKQLWNALLERRDFRIVLIPMNPKTDRKLMQDLAADVKHPERVEWLASDLPADVQACAAQCRAVVSSRLHLLILSANAGVPGLGIERGSKIANWLKAFHRTSSGSVEDCDFTRLEQEIRQLAEAPVEPVRAEMQEVMRQMRARLNHAEKLLCAALNAPGR